MNAPPSLLTQLRSFSRPARLFLIAIVIDGVVYSAWSLFFNFYILERGFDRQFLGLINSVPSIAALILGIPLGMLADRIGRKRAMLLGVAVYVLFCAVQVTTPYPTLMLVATFIEATGYTLFFLSQGPFMMQASKEDTRTLLFSLSFGLVTLSGAVGSLFAGQLPAVFGSWLGVGATSAIAYRAVLLGAIAVGSLTLIPLALIRLPQEKDSPLKPGGQNLTTTLRSVLGILSRPLTIKLAAPNLFIGFGAAILIPYLNVFFRERFAVTDDNLGVLFSLSALLTGVGSVLGPKLAHKAGGKIRAVVITQWLSLLFLLVMGFAPQVGWAVVGFLMRAPLMNLAMPLYSAFALEQVAEHEQATVNSVKELAWQVGWAVGPWLSGVAQARVGFGPIFVTTAVIYAFSTLLTWVFFKDTEAAKTISQPAPISILGD